jgi:hypothetical protein
MNFSRIGAAFLLGTTIAVCGMNGCTAAAPRAEKHALDCEVLREESFSYENSRVVVVVPGNGKVRSQQEGRVGLLDIPTKRGHLEYLLSVGYDYRSDIHSGFDIEAQLHYLPTAEEVRDWTSLDGAGRETWEQGGRRWVYVPAPPSLPLRHQTRVAYLRTMIDAVIGLQILYSIEHRMYVNRQTETAMILDCIDSIVRRTRIERN